MQSFDCKEIRMKFIIGLLAAAGLSGCVAYPAGYGVSGAYYGNGDGGYYSSAPGYSRGYRGDGRGYRDRDRDGVPNRYDRDRDGDGVPNRADTYPGNPRRY
jgi:hypothetical protein